MLVESQKESGWEMRRIERLRIEGESLGSTGVGLSVGLPLLGAYTSRDPTQL
jgi:hypothetical protein